MAFEHWDKLLYGIERGECILFLGPDLPLVPSGGERRSPIRALTTRLHQELERKAAGLDPGDLAQVSQHFLAQEDEVGLEMEVTRWHEHLAGERSTFHDDLAALPFRLIVTSGHDPLIETALREAGKDPAVERYHYRGRNKELLPEPSAGAPVLFHLYGHTAEPPSLVLTETQLLDFLTALISRNPPLPNDLNAALTNGRLFLFLGFGLDRWYLRILLHVLKVLRGSRAFAIEDLMRDGGAPEDGAVLFYRENFKVEIHHQDVFEFVEELRSRYVAPAAGPDTPAEIADTPPAGAAKVFLCHANEDKDRARQIHDALKRAGLDPWLDRESLRGGDRWDPMIEATIKEVDYFVVLNSRALAAKSRQASYVNKEINEALEAKKWRLVKHFIIPVKIDDAPLLDALAEYHAIDLGDPDGLRDLVRAARRWRPEPGAGRRRMSIRSTPRYKGMTPFQDLAIDRKTFFGRGHESRSLLSLVLAERLVVLFARSGMGKTSLLNAGLVEPLRHRGYFPAVVRLADTEHGPVASVFDGIRRAAREAGVDSAGGDEASLWHFFKTAELWSEGNDLLRPVLIIDQFEELFTLHNTERRRELVVQLAELVRGRTAASEPGSPLPERRGDAGAPDLKIVLSLRADFLGDLEELAPDIPAILHHRFRLGPLTREGARAAIVEPARLHDDAFETVAFGYREAAVDEILAFLAKRRHGGETVEGEEVEPFQLQLLCQYLEEKVRARESAGAGGGELEISAADVGGERHMQRVLEGFYDRTLAAIWPPREASRVRQLCEKRLISAGGRRLTEDEEEIERKYKVSKERLRQLVDARLLRSEPRLGGAFYELSHDTLVEPIRQSRRRRLARRRWTAAIAAGIALISLGLLGAWGRTQEAIKSSQRKALLQQIQPAPDVVFSAFWSLVRDHGEDAGEIGIHLQRLDLIELFERGPAKVSAAQRGEAVLRAWEVLRSNFENRPADFRAIAAVTWALDRFAGRKGSLTQRYQAARAEVLAPLRKQRPPPEPSTFDWADIPAGRFRMGSETGDGDERPVHEVELSAFRLLAHEVTNAEYRWFDPSHQGPDDHPVVMVSWYEAYAYAAWLGGRLPTEAEWEYATRVGTATRYWSGDEEADLEGVGWFDANSNGELQAVGQKLPNAWGLFDVHGNAWEWVADWYGPYSSDPQVEPWGPPGGEERVIRGGGYGNPARYARAAVRSGGDPEVRFVILGFRVVLPAAPSR